MDGNIVYTEDFDLVVTVKVINQSSDIDGLAQETVLGDEIARKLFGKEK